MVKIRCGIRAMHKIPSTIIEEPSEVSVKVAESEAVAEEEEKQERCLISIIADEDTCVGYILGGIGEINKEGLPNYFVVSPKTTDDEIEDAYWEFIDRIDIALILITVDIADRIGLPHKKSKNLPVVLEIPNKNGPYTIDIDHLLVMANDRENSDKMKSHYDKRASIASRASRRDSRESVKSARFSRRGCRGSTQHSVEDTDSDDFLF